jgi:K+-sensing histidine kinase KdpD
MGKRMWIVRGSVPVAASLALIFVITAVLWYVKLAAIGPHHLVFFYLLPIALLAMFYGSRRGLLCAFAAIACAAYFLYDPLYSFDIANRREFGDLVCFAILAVTGVKCAGALFARPAKVPVTKFPFERS